MDKSDDILKELTPLLAARCEARENHGEDSEQFAEADKKYQEAKAAWKEASDKEATDGPVSDDKA